MITRDFSTSTLFQNPLSPRPKVLEGMYQEHTIDFVNKLLRKQQVEDVDRRCDKRKDSPLQLEPNSSPKEIIKVPISPTVIK